MRFRTVLCFALAALAISGAGCLPSGVKDETATPGSNVAAPPPPATQPAVPAQPSAPEELAPPASPGAEAGSSGDSEPHETAMNIAGFTPEQANAQVQVTRALDGNGYVFEGRFGIPGMALSGSIVPAADGSPLWTMLGHFTFPTGGYWVGAPFLTTLGGMQIPVQPGMTPIDVPQLIVNIPIRLPAKDQEVTKDPEQTNVTMDIPAGLSTSFFVNFSTL